MVTEATLDYGELRFSNYANYVVFQVKFGKVKMPEIEPRESSRPSSALPSHRSVVQWGSKKAILDEFGRLVADFTGHKI